MILKFGNSSIDVETQFDNKYSTIATRQCSWFTFEAMKRRKELLDAFNDTEKYISIYSQCLAEATLNKLNSNCRKDIETLFHENILSKYEIKCQFYKMEYNLDGYDYYKNLNYPNTEDVIKTKKSFPLLSEKDLISKLDQLQKYDFMMTNRLIMSYIVIKIDNDNYLLVDSHVPKSTILSIKEVIDYIKYNETTKYNLVTLVFEQK